jgi:hypothetical protein
MLPRLADLPARDDVLAATDLGPLVQALARLVDAAALVVARLAPPPAEARPAAPRPDPPPDDRATLTDTQEAIEAVLRLTDKPLKVATIAIRANRVFNSHFRAEMGRLRRAGRVVATPEHRYWLAGRGVPPGT